MPTPKKQKNRPQLNAENWRDLVHVSLDNAVARIPDESYQRIINHVAPVLIATGFFDRTPFKGLCLTLQIISPLERDTAPIFESYKGELFAERPVRYEEIGYLSLADYIDFNIGVAAEVIIAACTKYGLDPAPAQSLAEQFPVAPTAELSLITFGSKEVLEEPSDDRLSIPLTNEELVFPGFDEYNWCVRAPGLDQKLDKIGPDTLNVCVPVGLTGDQYVNIANAMLRAPKANLRIQGMDQTGFLPCDLWFLKYFRHLRRICFENGNYTNLEELRLLSPDLIKLQLFLDFHKSKRPSLEPLRHFQALQSLTLRGYYEDLSQFPNLNSLRALQLINVRIQDLSSLTSMDNLQSLLIANCKIQDLSALAKVGRLQYLSLVSLPNIVRLDELEGLCELEYLELDGLNKLESMPPLLLLTKLRRISLSSLKMLSDLSPISRAPHLVDIWIHSSKQLKPKNLECFRGHPTLKGFRTDDSALERALGLPRLGTAKTFEFSLLEPATPKTSQFSSAATRPIISQSTRETDNLEDDDSENSEELRIFIKTNDSLGQEAVYCSDLEDRFEQILKSDLLGHWDGHDILSSGYRIFFLGPDAACMYKALRSELKKSLPAGSYIELEDSSGKVVTKRF